MANLQIKEIMRREFVKQIQNCLILGASEKVKSEMRLLFKLKEHKSIGCKKHHILIAPSQVWYSGKTIHFVDSSNKLIATPISSTLVQKISLTFKAKKLRIFLDGRFLSDSDIELLSINEGYSNVNQMAEVLFIDNPAKMQLSGVLISWTNHKYNA